MKCNSFIQRRPLGFFFILAYSITWGSILVLLWIKGFQLSAIRMQEAMLMFVMMLLGPSASGLILSAASNGRNGLGELGKRLKNWRADWRWYGIALGTVPALFLIILAALHATVSPAFTPRFQILGVFVGIMAGGLEEIGWTGFATPRLLKKYDPLTAGLILGLVWAFWHSLADFSGNFSTMGAGWLLWFPIFWLLPLTAYRMLMTWVYSNTKSLPVAQLMHASYSGWLFVLSPATSFKQGLVWQIVFAASLWMFVLAVFIRNRSHTRTAPDKPLNPIP